MRDEEWLLELVLANEIENVALQPPRPGEFAVARRFRRQRACRCAIETGWRHDIERISRVVALHKAIKDFFARINAWNENDCRSTVAFLHDLRRSTFCQSLIARRELKIVATDVELPQAVCWARSREIDRRRTEVVVPNVIG